jgi:tetratricopeptide (TPR) repeat protein
MRPIRAFLAVSAIAAALGVSAAAAEETPPAISPAEAEAAAAISKEERIDSLFATLKSETDKDAAGEVEDAILRLWLESGSDTVDLLMSWTLKAMQAKEYPRALDFLDRVILMAPDYAEGWNKRATVHFLMEDYGKSIADIGRVLELEPRHFGALSGLGMILRSLGDDRRAIAAYRQALDVDPHLDDVREALDELEEKTGGQDI